jgi:hypothetical protein
MPVLETFSRVVSILERLEQRVESLEFHNAPMGPAGRQNERNALKADIVALRAQINRELPDPNEVKCKNPYNFPQGPRCPCATHKGF